jgi:TonB-linked SusC/RagA family outer membrane protein
MLKLMKPSAIKVAMAMVAFALAILIAPAAYAQTLISGTVIDHNNDPVIGASVIVKGTKAGVATGMNGEFAIKAEPANYLEVSAIGYTPTSVKVGNQKKLTIVLQENSELLDEVVVIGYGQTTKKELTGSVASVKKDELNPGSYTNAMGMLQGKVAGLQIVNPNGADPTAKYQILLRGTNTLAAGQGPLVIIDGVVGADIRNINMQDIESIDVLKDGSAAAIYGTRGTNGVIFVTTKRARAGRTEVTYDGQFSVSTVSRRATPLTASEFNYVIDTYRPEMSSSKYGSDTDWFDQITRTPFSHKHTISISGGTEKFSHATSLNYEKAEGLQKKNDYEKIAARTNIRQSLLDGWLEFDVNLFVNHRKYNPSNTNAFSQAFFHNPTEPVYDATNTTSGGYYRIAEMEYYNPVAMINERTSTVVNDNFGGNARATLNIKPIPGLKWDAFLSLSRESNEQNTYSTQYYPSLIGTGGKAEIDNYKSNDTQFETTLHYTRAFGLHSIQALLGYNYQKSTDNYANMENQGFDFDDFETNNIGSGSGLLNNKAELYSYKESNTYIGFFGRVLYNYDDRYMGSVSLRRDGSSRFGKNNKWGWFPAVSLGWRLSREAFLRDVEWLNELKLRGGYGITGNQDFSNYKSLILMSTAGKFWYNGEWINTYQPASNPNPDLQWEKKKEFNIGIDAQFLNNRLGFTFDYYHRTTDNLLYSYTVPTPPYIYDTLFTNVGKVTNQGIELTITATPVQTRDFTWNTTYLIAHNTNKLNKFTNEEFTNGTYKVGWSSPGKCYTQRLIEGESLGTFYGPIYLGTDTDGNDVLLGQGDDGSVPEEQWVKLGTAYPKVTMSWTNNFTWRNWDLGFSLRASIGGKVLNDLALRYSDLSRIGLYNITNKWLDEQNRTSVSGNKYSSKYVENASFLKLDNISLGYTFRFANKFIRSLRLSFTAQNVFTITGYKGVDPEVGITGIEPGLEGLTYYPRTTDFTFGVTAKF